MCFIFSTIIKETSTIIIIIQDSCVADKKSNSPKITTNSMRKIHAKGCFRRWFEDKSEKKTQQMIVAMANNLQNGVGSFWFVMCDCLPNHPNSAHIVVDRHVQ